jgi:hypothetical protein
MKMTNTAKMIDAATPAERPPARHDVPPHPGRRPRDLRVLPRHRDGRPGRVVSRAYGVVNALVRDGILVYEAIYQPSYRHNARRLDSALDLDGPCGGHHYPTESAAALAIERAAERDGADVTVQAGSYPRGTRRRGEVISLLTALSAVRS